jgi:hypothetical protein
MATLSGPDFSSLAMPPLPPDLADRAQAVHDRHLRLQSQLIAAMSSVDRQMRIVAATDRPGAAHYFDRSL